MKKKTTGSFTDWKGEVFETPNFFHQDEANPFYGVENADDFTWKLSSEPIEKVVTLESWLEMQELKTKQQMEKEHQDFLDFLYSRIGKEDCKVLNQLGSVAKKLVIHRNNSLEDIYVQPLTTDKINELEEAIRDSNSITLGY